MTAKSGPVSSGLRVLGTNVRQPAFVRVWQFSEGKYGGNGYSGGKTVGKAGKFRRVLWAEKIISLYKEEK